MIAEFQGKYRFLSNFYTPSCVRCDMGILYGSTEAAYQASKFLDRKIREQFVPLEPYPSKKLAKKLKKEGLLRKDWEQVNIGIMRELLKQKFADPVLRKALLETGDEELVEGNWWDDTFWGVCNGVGENHLGKLLMELRKELGGQRKKPAPENEATEAELEGYGGWPYPW